MRVVFIGAVEFSRHCLSVLIQERANVVAVMSPDSHAAAGNSDRADLEPLATAHGLPFYGFRSMRDTGTIELIRSLSPDVIFVLGLSQLIPRELLQIPRLGCIGSHPTMLPKHRGRHPLIWAIIEGLQESGLTFFFLDEGADSGDILWQRAFPITDDDTAATLYQKVIELGAAGIREFLPQLIAGNASRTPQDHSEASYWPKRTQADGLIHWEQSALRVHNLVRALTQPYPGADSVLQGKPIKVWRTRLADEATSGLAPGTVVRRTTDGVLIQCKDVPLELLAWDGADGRLEPSMRLGGEG